MGILDMLYPVQCPVCHRVLTYGEGYICSECRERLSFVHQPFCMRCGKELEEDDPYFHGEFCPDCEREDKGFSGGVALLNYDEITREIMAELKYKNKRGYAEFLADEMTRRHGRQILRWHPDCLIPVPVHKQRFRERGYNQAEILAKKLGQNLGIPVERKFLIRTQQTAAQKKLGYSERQKNEKTAFMVPEGKKIPGVVVLVDDIYTTGATAKACTSALKKSGISEVYLANMSISKRK